MQRKTQIKGMVKKHLDPHFRHDGTGITKEQYTMINQRVSRICYENLPPLEGMDDSEKCTWERRIKREVEKGVMKCLNEASGEKKEDKVERAGVAA